MSFDKVKAMRNAERFLAQGKIRAAINEYKRVVEADKTDYGTLNMLGDLYVKASDSDEAVHCFTQVAEHYSKQGFAQKAIAIYNKISRLKPDSIEVSAKLAQLYQMKGSVAEARTHYTTLAEQYSRTGKKAEALIVWKQIASLDPNNTDIYLKIADACWQDQQKEEAANAYIEAGKRLSAKEQFEPAITAFSRALEIRPDDLPALKGFVQSQMSLGYSDEAAKSLESSLARQPYNREIMYLLVDCYVDMGNLFEAEKTVIKLVEQEPSNYPKLLDLVNVYLKNADLESATRMLSMASEHLLVGGQAQELEKLIDEVLARNPEQIDAIRLLVRFNNWQRDEAGIKTSLERLAEAARINNAVDDERYALSQLIMIVPQNAYFAQRLQELNLANGFSQGYYENPQTNTNSTSDVPTFESFSGLGQEDEAISQSAAVFAEYGADLEYVNGNGNGSSNGSHKSNAENENIEESISISEYDLQPEVVEVEETETQTSTETRELSEFEKHNLLKEIEGVDFYVEQGFKELAEKTLDDLESRYGKRPEIAEIRQTIKSEKAIPTEEETETTQTAEEIHSFNKTEEVFVESNQFENFEPKNVAETIELPKSSGIQSFDPLNDMKTELASLESSIDDEDFETSYQTGIAYREMGLIEEAIREFQEAIKMVSIQDGTRKFFLCCNLLGHCFMDKEMPNIALMWFKRGLESPNLNEDELNGLRYELANAYEKGGDKEKAKQYFEELYGLDVSFRDVTSRLQKLLRS